MSKETFIDVNFRPQSLQMLALCNEIIDLYMAQGLRLTLRQLYYQLVTRNTVTNTERSYKNLGKLVSQGRLAGELDWEAIEDRLRMPHQVAEWRSPADIMNAVMQSYTLPRWEPQPAYVELWCEKDALAGVLLPITQQYHVTLMVNRGYSSQSAMKEAAERLTNAFLDGKKSITILYIGDQDPSGEDMVRDVGDRLTLLTRDEFDIEVVKLAITEDQVAQYNPPPNPTKLSDSRAEGYIAKFGNSSYEADALPPDILAAVVREAIEAQIDPDLWQQVIDAEETDKRLLEQARDEVMRLRDEAEDDDQE